MKTSTSVPLMQFKHVSFGYVPERLVLKEISLTLEVGKTYALVGPTGGGKSTTASLMARLYSPTEGVIEFRGRDIRDWSSAELSIEIGFILQEPFLFSGTPYENIIYGNARLENMSREEVEREVELLGLGEFLRKLPESEHISLGQKQLIAFLRAVLRKPKFLILDEATANIDTVTEQLLSKALAGLPAETTKVIIAHRLNTIREADTIFFVNDGKLTEAGSFESALELIEKSKKRS